MEKLKTRLPSLSQLNHREKALLCVIIGLIVAIVVVTCISINIRVNMQREYTGVRDKLGESLYSNLYMLTQTFDMTSVPNADVKNSIIPQMKNYFIAATTLNEAVVNNYGQRYQVLTDADVSTLRTTFNAYDAAFRSDAPTDLAQADMQGCMDRVKELLSSRYSEGILRASR
ncbi:MAG: hypothetical protein IJ646_08030 [Clostridia bacterium]|nr:hypothetical protein [Clostridia bacterium]